MIFLGINCGFGNDDVSRLEETHLTDGWVELPRHKTGVDRRCPLWRETSEAICGALAEREPSSDPEASNRVFRSQRGGPYESTKNSNLSQEFRKLLTASGLYRRGVGFYALRHMTATVGSRSCDQQAVDTIMGHRQDTVQAGYREWIDDSRLEAVASHIRDWLFQATHTS